MTTTRHGAIAEAGRARTGSRPDPAPIYIVCSPRRRVGKTLLSRLLVEYHLSEGRRIAAIDLGDESPQLSDYLPKLTTIADVSETRGQMALFDGLLMDEEVPKVVDVSHRAFKDFFGVVQKIGLFEEARDRGMETLMLFMVDQHPASAQAYQVLSRWFTNASLLPVHNHAVAAALPPRPEFKDDDTPDPLEIPLLRPPLRWQVDQHSFSFAKLREQISDSLPVEIHIELESWTTSVFLQVRQIELALARYHAAMTAP
jgi:hypothetical protein